MCLTFDHVIKAYEDNQVSYDLERNMLDFLQDVAVDKDLRSASTDADKKLSDSEVDMSATVQRVVGMLLPFWTTSQVRPFLIFFLTFMKTASFLDKT